MKYGILSLLVSALSCLDCAVSMPEKPAAPTVVVAVESDPAPTAAARRDDGAVPAPPDVKPRRAIDVRPEQGTEYSFDCMALDFRNGWRSEKITVFERWVEPKGSIRLVPILDLNALAGEAKRKFEAKNPDIQGLPGAPKTKCTIQSLTLFSIVPVLADSP